MSIRITVRDGRLVMDLDRASMHIELPFRADSLPLIDTLVPGFPVRIEQDTTANVLLSDKWLFSNNIPLTPIGSEGSIGDGITISRRRIDS